MAVILRVRTIMTYGSGGPGLNTQYFSPGTVGGSVADATDVVARVRTCWAAVAPQFAPTMSLQVESDVAAIEATTGALTGTFSATPVAAVVGSAAGSSVPPVLQLLMRLRTGTVINGRLLRGRQYLGPAGALVQGSGGVVQASSVTAFNSAYNAMLVTSPTTSFPAVWHRPVNAAAGGHALVSSYSMWSTFAELRSRRDG